MGWFSPKPLALKYGEPVHLLVARATNHNGVLVKGEFLPHLAYHFTGPHGVEYKGTRAAWRGVPEEIAKLCEEVQQDFNERQAAEKLSISEARIKQSLPALFRRVEDEKE